MHKSMKKWGVPLLLVLAILIAGVVTIATVVGSADPAEIQDFGVQHLAALDLPNDDETDLRFVFTIGKLDYEEVGFVISKTNSTPAIDVPGCYKATTDTVYYSITADSVTTVAGAGRHWVAIKLTDIPRSYFDGTLYVRAFVKDGEDPRYSDVASTTICLEAGHTAHTINDLAHGMKSGTAAMNVVGTKVGYCSVCKLDNVTQYGATTSLEYKKWVGGGANDSWIDDRQISDVLAGGKHFYPDASNNYEGNDLYAEFSILWNESLLDFSGEVNDGARFETIFASSKSDSTTYGNTKAITYCSLTNDVEDAGCKYAGGFEFPCGQIKTSAPGNPYPGMTSGGGAYSDYPNIGGTDRLHPEWGWHRIGIIYHEDVENIDAVESSGADAQYKMTVTIKIDGEVVSILSGTDLSSSGKDYKLYTVEKDGDDLVYTDINEDYYFLLFKMASFQAVGGDVYFVDGDLFVTAGHDFVHPVTRIDNPAARTETVDGHDFNGAFYYTTVGSHDHVWGSLVNDASHDADCATPATQSIHCTVCGATKPGSTVELPIDPSLHAYGDWEQITAPTLVTKGRERRTCTNCGGYDYRDTAYAAPTEVKYTNTNRAVEKQVTMLSDLVGDGKHFYPDSTNGYQGNDLLIEYSLLWNSTLSKLRNNEGYCVLMQRLATSDALSSAGASDLAWMSLKANLGESDCKFAGGFEYGALRTVEVGPATMSTTKANDNKCSGSTYGDFPNIGGVESGNIEYGWHRVQIRVHQELTNEAAVKSGSESPAYYLYVEVYVDGVLLFRNSNAESDIFSNATFRSEHFLFTASRIDNGGALVNGLYYLDNSDSYLGGFYVPARRTSSGNAYLVYGDYECFAGQDFMQSVEKVEFPEDATYTASDGTTINAPFYYKPTGGASEPKVYDSKNALGRDFIVTEHLTNVLDGDHFYPTAGNANGKALYFETDFLWNSDIMANYKDGDGFRFRLKNYAGATGTSVLYLLVPKNNVWGSSDAKTPGGFDYGWTATHNITYGPMGVDGTGTNAENFPNIGADGWHKIGIKLYQTATANGASNVDYTVVSTLYIDGAKVWEITYTGNFASGDGWLDHGTMLFTATNDGGNLTYADPDYTLCMDFMGGGSHSSGQKYFVYDNVSWSVVAPNFAPAYSPVVSPAAATYTLPDDSEIDAPVYFQAN